MDVAGWLQALGLEKYQAAFRENGVSTEDLRHLTAEDLEGLGVTAIGHRRRLLVAIAKLRDDDAAAPQAISSTADHRASTSAGERRQLTVMFCDLVGSTALSESSTPKSCAACCTRIEPSAAMSSRATTALSPAMWVMAS